MSGSTRRSFDAESVLRSLMDNVPGAIYRCSTDGIWKMQRVSVEIESITGYPVADFIGASKRSCRQRGPSSTPAWRSYGSWRAGSTRRCSRAGN